MAPLLQNKHILTKPKMTNFNEQRAITIEDMVPYGPLSNLRKTLWSKQCDPVP